MHSKNGINKFYKKWLNEINNYYVLESHNLILAGGGSSKVYNLFKKEFPEALIVSDVKANSIGFKAIGEKKWQKIRERTREWK